MCRESYWRNCRWYRSLFKGKPTGWGRRTKRRLAKVIEDTNTYIQKLNDMYTNPSGSESGHPASELLSEKQTQPPDTAKNPGEKPLETTSPKDASGR